MKPLLPLGFTLIEVLLALVLAGLMLTAVTRLIRQNTLLERQVTAWDDETRGVDVLFDWMARDFQCVRSGVNVLSTSPGELFRFEGIAPFSTSGTRGSLRLPAEIVYRREALRDGHLRIIREQRDLTSQGSRWISWTLMEDAEQLTCEYRDDHEWRSGSQANQNTPPKAIRVALKTDRGSKVNRVFCFESPKEVQHALP